jgi:aspartate/methionine/tyrosine aminotransferase
VIVSNPVEAIFLFAHAVLQPGDHAIVVWPAYQALYDAARGAGVAVTLLPLSPEAGWQLDLDALRAAMRPNTRAIVINSPHNPTGALIDARTFEAIVGLARDAGAWLFSDEMYRFLEFDPADRLPAGADTYERGISLGGMSKSFAMGGARIGWLATRDRDLLARVARLKDYTSICNSAPGEILAFIALRARDRVLARSQAIVRANLERLDRFFHDWRETVSWVRPRGGSIAFPSLRADWPIDTFARDLLQQEGVMIVPGSVFEFSGNHFRLGYGRPNLPQALERLERRLSVR